jgi:membrane protease YdiL (CAAX protease family)
MGIFICFSFISFIGALAQHFSGKAQFDVHSPLFVLLFMPGLHWSVLLGTGLFLFFQRIRWAEAFGFSLSPIGSTILAGVITALVFVPIGMLLQWASLEALEQLHLTGTDQPAVEALQTAVKPLERSFLIVFAIVIAPISEEILFRGILYPAIKQLGYRRTALWVTSLTFAAFHQTPAIFLPLTVLALFLTILYEMTDNLLAPITAHAVFNTIGVLEIYGGDLGRTIRVWLHHAL